MMKPPEHDLENRRPIWEAMHLLYLDTDVDEFHFDDIAHACSASKYTLTDLEAIYWSEVYPTMRYNLYAIAGDWRPFDTHSLTTAILKRHKFGKVIRFKRHRKYAFEYWNRLAKAIKNRRETS